MTENYISKKSKKEGDEEERIKNVFIDTTMLNICHQLSLKIEFLVQLCF